MSSTPKTLTTGAMGELKDHRPQLGSTVASAARTKESRCREVFATVEIGNGATAREVIERSKVGHRVAAGQRVPRPLQIESRQGLLRAFPPPPQCGRIWKPSLFYIRRDLLATCEGVRRYVSCWLRAREEGRECARGGARGGSRVYQSSNRRECTRRECTRRERPRVSDSRHDASKLRVFFWLGMGESERLVVTKKLCWDRPVETLSGGGALNGGGHGVGKTRERNQKMTVGGGKA